MNGDERGQSSAGHKLGQLVGDWFQDYFVVPLLQDVANALGLYLDHRLSKRHISVRGDKIIWFDQDRNGVDYDFVMEIGGSTARLGIPAAFFECFWRRGARHSKDKARDDSGKLVPMRDTYPTARFLGIVASGEFTRPARELVESRKINLFYVPKAKVVQAFASLDLVMDYNDRATEETKAEIADRFAGALTEQIKQDAAGKLRDSMGDTAIMGYIASVQAALSSAPQEFRIVEQRFSAPEVFDTVDDVSRFLAGNAPNFDFSNPQLRYCYQVTYSDGTEFEREIKSLELLKTLHGEIATLANHMSTVTGTAIPKEQPSGAKGQTSDLFGDS